jgi:MYXO-CTERM domain-containing protein
MFNRDALASLAESVCSPEPERDHPMLTRTTLALVAACASLAQAQTVTYSVVLSTSGPVPTGAAVEATVRVAWSGASGIGYAGGALRMRLDGVAASQIDLPSEVAADHIGVGGQSTVWGSGRRPRADRGGGLADGGFRFPPAGSGPTSLAYRAETQGGIAYLTARNGGNTEVRIEHAQLPPGLMQVDSTLFVSEASFDLFKFVVHAPAFGNGTVTVTPEVTYASIFTSAAGANVRAQFSATAASFTYTPAPAGLAVLGIGGLLVARRRR